MSESPPDVLVEALDVLAAGTSEPVARFRFEVATSSWWWSEAMYRLHGFRPGEVVPSTALLMAHKHAEDRARTEQQLVAVLATGEPFCCRHRIIDAAGRERMVLSLGEGMCDASGAVCTVQGYFIDVTDSMRQVIDAEARDAVQRSAEARAVIEQAKGLLIGIYRIDADAAFDLLRWHSQQTNTKLRVLADRLVRHFSDGEADSISPARRVSTHMGVPGGVAPFPQLPLH
jgi:hypothetical protein